NFFQAEDGIRVYEVTGVQTCALPISSGGALSPTIGANSTGNIVSVTAISKNGPANPASTTDDGIDTSHFYAGTNGIGPVLADARSEERRVGKECRSRCAE